LDEGASVSTTSAKFRQVDSGEVAMREEAGRVDYVQAWVWVWMLACVWLYGAGVNERVLIVLI
jgi:hypothetical protein